MEAIAAVTTRDRILIAAHREGDTQMIEIPDKVVALLDAVRALDETNVPYALVGGIAVGIHSGVPRATEDTDLAVCSTVDRRLVTTAFTAAGFAVVSAADHSAIFQHSTGEPIHLMYDAAFNPMIERAERFEARGVSIPIVSKDDLIAMKERAAADPRRRRSTALRDLADVELLRGEGFEPHEEW